MDDFQYTIDILERFFNQSKIQKSLAIISEEGITGWETWLQIEFSTFLAIQYSEDLEWEREYQLRSDQRKDKERSKMAVDFIFRRKGTRKHRYIVIEFKQHPNPKSCIGNMMKDVLKVECKTPTSIDMRQFWVIGIHEKGVMSKSEIRDYVCDRNDNVDRDLVYTKFISNTNYAFTIF